MARSKIVDENTVTTEFPNESPFTPESMNGDGSGHEAPELGLDDLFEQDVDLEEQKAVQVSLLLPAGQYVKLAHEPGFETTFTRTRLTDVETLVKGEDGEYEPTVLPTRDIVSVNAVLQAKDGSIKRHRIRVSWQPVYRQYDEQPIKPDSPTKLYNMAFNLYKRLHPDESVSVGQVINMLVEDTYKVYITQYGTREGSTIEPGNSVSTISKA